MKPAEFKDASGNTWGIKLTMGLLDDLKGHCQLDVLAERQGDETTPLSKLLWDTDKLCEVLWLCIRQFAEPKGIEKDEWRGSLGAEELSSGWNALKEAVVNFFHCRNAKMGEAMEAMYEAEVEVMDRGAEHLQKVLENDGTKEIFNKAFSDLDVKLEQMLRENVRKVGAR